MWYDEKYPMYMGIPLGMEVGAVYVPTTTTTAQRKSTVSQLGPVR